MRRSGMTKNFIFRFYECNLSIEEAAKLCFKSERTVTNWDKGKEIPKECKRLMRMAKGRELHQSKQWEGFEMIGDKLKLPTGYHVSPQQILVAIGLLEIQTDIEIKSSTFLLKTARKLAFIINNKPL